MDNILVIAQQFGVSETDLKGFTQSIINEMQKDGVVDAFLTGDIGEYTRAEIIEAYAMSAVSKMQMFVTKYTTDPIAAEAFHATVRNLLCAR